MLELEKIRPPSLNNECYLRLKEAILIGHFPWGDRLDVNILAENFGISKFPVIKALDRLAMEHLVTILPNKGTFVLSPTIKDVEEVTEIRIMLENLAFTLATEKNLSRLIQMLESKEQEKKWNFEDFSKGLEVGVYLRYDREYHFCFFICSENKRLMDYFEAIRNI